MDRQEYRYERIDLETHAFRLLHVHRGFYGSPMCCEIFHSFVSGDLGVPYEALSYTWGDLSVPTVPIDILNQSTSTLTFLNIYPNLHDILQNLRREHEDRVLWVDAICIDQSKQKDSLRERTHQVEQMKLVYERADRIIVWLGSLDCISGTGSDAIAMLADASKRLKRMPIVESTRIRDTPAWNLARQAVVRDHSEEEYEQMHAAMSHLLDHPYFTRVWIIQEVASARSGHVVCGDRGITVSIPMRVFMLLPSLFKIRPARHVQAVLDVMPVSYQRRTGWWNEKNDLGTLLVKFQDSECTDPRDSVFALLGISSDPGVLQAIRPDYRLSVEEVFHNALSWLLFSETAKDGKPGFSVITLPNRNFWIQDAGNITTLSHKILMWVLEHGSNTTAAKILGSGNVKIDQKVIEVPQPRISWTLRVRRGPRATTKQLLGPTDLDANMSSEAMSALSFAANNGQILETCQFLLSGSGMGIPSVTTCDTECRLLSNGLLSMHKAVPEIQVVVIDKFPPPMKITLVKEIEIKVASEVIRLLLCEPNATNFQDGSAAERAQRGLLLMGAVEDGHLHGVRLFLDLQEEFKIYQGFSQNSLLKLLQLRIKKRYGERLFTDNGVDENISRERETMYYIACIENIEGRVGLLL